ncbi:restriction endonuclease subunit S [Bacillus mycoides]|uniref:restriction endonuclease subunit S n=1 Tax=Bacillus mycoides TaxID=1405 RepID=UPI003F7538A2
MVINLNDEKPNCNWSESPLNILLVLLKDGTHNPPKRSETGIPMLSAVNIQDGKIIFDENVSFIKEEYYKQMHKNYEIQEGDVLLTIVGTLGRVAEVPKLDTKFTVQRSVAILRTKIDLVTPRYLRYYMESSDFQNQLKVRSNVTAQAGIYLGELGKLQIRFPNLHEQSKIVSILSSVDEAIEKTEAIIQQTEGVKKGLMQQLLTKGIGHSRFKKTKIGEIPEKWELLSIGAIAKLQGGYAFKSKDYITEGIQLIRISNLFGKFLNLAKDPVYLPLSYKEDYEGCVLKEGDLIICMTGTVGKEDYGHVVKIPQDSKPFLLNQRVGRFILQKQGVDRNFLYWFLASRLFLDVIYSFGNGTKQANLSAKQIESVLIPLPPKEEQMKISEVLDSIDKKVEIEKDKLYKLQEIKQGLMQSLLAGHVRVEVDEVEVTQV